MTTVHIKDRTESTLKESYPITDSHELNSYLFYQKNQFNNKRLGDLIYKDD